MAIPKDYGNTLPTACMNCLLWQTASFKRLAHAVVMPPYRGQMTDLHWAAGQSLAVGGIRYRDEVVACDACDACHIGAAAGIWADGGSDWTGALAVRCDCGDARAWRQLVAKPSRRTKI